MGGTEWETLPCRRPRPHSLGCQTLLGVFFATLRRKRAISLHATRQSSEVAWREPTRATQPRSITNIKAPSTSTADDDDVVLVLALSLPMRCCSVFSCSSEGREYDMLGKRNAVAGRLPCLAQQMRCTYHTKSS